MATLTIRFDDKVLRDALKRSPTLAMRSAVRAINQTAAQAQTAGVRRLSSATKIPVRKIRERIRLRKARFGPNAEAALTALTAGVPIDAIASRALKKGGISAAGQRFPHAFRATMRNGRELIMERRVTGGQRAARLPIERVKIPLNPMADSIFLSEINAKASSVMSRIFEKDFRFRLERGF